MSDIPRVKRAYRELFRPKDNDSCLCGSGLAFASCCMNQLPGHGLGKGARDALSRRDWEAALIACRSDITQYTIWHKTNTEPIMKIASGLATPLLSVDIEAMGELAGDLGFVYWRLGRQSELPVVLERLRANISDARWHRKVTYLQALAAHAANDSRVARAEFEKLGPITDHESDLEVLQLYMDLYGDELSFSRRIGVCDQILKLTKNAGDRLQYQGFKAFNYALIGDLGQARTEFSGAIAEARKQAADGPLSVRARSFLAGNLIFLGVVSNASSMLDEAAAILKQLLSEDTWTPAGRASLYEQLGECCRYAGRWKEGEEAYREALAIEPSGFSTVFLAECVLRQGNIKEAARVIDAVTTDHLDHNQKADYAFTAAAIAVETGDGDRMRKAIGLLEEAKTDAPYFEERRLKLIIQVQSAMTGGKTPAIRTAIQKLLSGPVRYLNRYLIVQPTVFGIGINFNAMVDDLERPKRKK